MQASTQALVGQGGVTSIEDVNLDVESLGLHVLSSLFQHVTQVKKNPNTKSKSADLAVYIPKAAQVALIRKACNCKVWKTFTLVN